MVVVFPTPAWAPAALLLLLGCADFRAVTLDELLRHPPHPQRRFDASLAAWGRPEEGDWLMYLTHGPPLRGHVMEGWERVTVTHSQNGGADIEFAFFGQAPFDQIEGSAHLDTTQSNPRGQFVLQVPNAEPRKIPLPWMESWIGGRHSYEPGDWGRRRATTPGLVDIRSAYDEQLRVRVVPLSLGVGTVDDQSLPHQDVTVPAGEFSSAAVFSVTVESFQVPFFWEMLGVEPAHRPYGPVKIWIHPAVPATRVVKMEFQDGATLELLDFGRAARR